MTAKIAQCFKLELYLRSCYTVGLPMSLTSGPGPPVIMEKDKPCLHSDNDNVIHTDTGSADDKTTRRIEGQEEEPKGKK